MAAKGATFENSLLLLIFQGSAIAGFALNATASPLTNLYVSLHTGTLTSASAQNTSEAAYGAYARATVARTSGGWTVSTNTVSPVATISFPMATSGSETETYFAVGTTSAGVGQIMYFGTITPNILVTTNVTPQLTTSSTITES